MEKRFHQLQRKRGIGLLAVLVLSGCVLLMMPGVGTTADATYASAVLMDYETGQVLIEENARESVIPASIVKMMVLLLAMERLESGALHLDDTVTVSAWASHIGGHQVYLAEGETFRLEELLKAIAISSANDAATAVAEFLAGGDADTCVELMNARAQELGMTNTVFANEHGLPPDKGQKENYTTAHDIALLGRELLQYPQVLAWTSTLEDTFRDGEFILTNTNRQLLRKYRGADGLKTGFHARGAGFNLCATAKRGDRRLIAVVMGAPRKVDRYRAVVNLLNRGFSEFERVVALRKGFSVGNPIPVAGGKKRATTVVASDNAVVVVEKGQKELISQNIRIPTQQISAPVSKGTRVGEAVILVDEQPVTTVDLAVEETIEKGSLVDRLKWWLVDKVS
jgi:serine-type D-Ala-D-Ala carboxypeptidase (penicillin-binding protein 5/6)